jgi:hypothetical protein
MSRTLAAEVRRKEKEFRTLRDKLEKQQMLAALPSLKRKYEGKYFVYDNGYNNEERWPVYVFCKKVVASNYYDNFIIDSFEISPKKCEFGIGISNGDFLFQKEITKKKYETALEDFLKAANRLTQSKIKSSRKKQ